MSKPTSVGSLKRGQSIVINGEPYKIVSLEKSKPGKHGSAKARITAIHVFNNTKKSIVSPVNAKIDVPLIEKRTAQVVYMEDDSVQLMDLESYESFFALKPTEKEMLDKLSANVEVEYWNVLGRTKIVRVKGPS
ncbi:MAG: translation initiation factor IF-5A [Candidatus Bathyarchaeota archaeon]|nr:translation initiation factor IF-5A [Candidatus Bathyarchaeota archaeon]